MKYKLNAFNYFVITKLIGFVLLFILRINESDPLGFFLFLILLLLFVFRLRIKNSDSTIYLDFITVFIFIYFWEYSHYALLLVLFEGMFLRKYLILFSFVYAINSVEFSVIMLSCSLMGFYLGKWSDVINVNNLYQFDLKSKIYELEDMRRSLVLESRSDIRNATLTERARISRDIHDNAGHDLIAAYISFQTIQNLIKDNDTKKMYDAALDRLSCGVNEIRDVLHNVSPVFQVGIDEIIKLCDEFILDVELDHYGNMADVPVYLWSVLMICLKESFSNILKHSASSSVNIRLDVSDYIVRLSIINDGVFSGKKMSGRGLMNMRFRIESVGGNLSYSNDGNFFKLICVMPIKEGDIK